MFLGSGFREFQSKYWERKAILVSVGWEPFDVRSLPTHGAEICCTWQMHSCGKGVLRDKAAWDKISTWREPSRQSCQVWGASSVEDWAQDRLLRAFAWNSPWVEFIYYSLISLWKKHIFYLKTSTAMRIMSDPHLLVCWVNLREQVYKNYKFDILFLVKTHLLGELPRQTSLLTSPTEGKLR